MVQEEEEEPPMVELQGEEEGEGNLSFPLRYVDDEPADEEVIEEDGYQYVRDWTR